MSTSRSSRTWRHAVDVIKGTQFTMRLPADVKAKTMSIMQRYAKDMVVHPTLDVGKVVVEVSETPDKQGATHTIRILATVLFGDKYKMMRSLAEGTKDDSYFESWMATMTGCNGNEGFEVLSLTLYVRREGGWEAIVTESNGQVDGSDQGEAWPEPPREPTESPREDLTPWT